MLDLKSFKRIALDIETNGLLQHLVDFKKMPLVLNDTARLWLIVLTDVDNPENNVKLNLQDCTSENMKICFKNCTEVVFHNGVKFDAFALKLFKIFDYKIYFYQDKDGNNGEVFGKPVKITDTLILSKVLSPDRWFGHSLDSWGKQLGDYKEDYRQICIDKGYIDKSSPRGAEFAEYHPEIIPYCVQDTRVTILILAELLKEKAGFNIDFAYHMELKIADLTVKQEFYGFDFDKKLAEKNVSFLNKALEERRELVNPLLPPKRLNKTEAKSYYPPKRQFKQNGDITADLVKFLERLGATINEDKTEVMYEDRKYYLPLDTEICLKQTIDADIEDLNHVKSFLILQGWVPSEWVERDLTRESGKKARASDQKIKETIDRYVADTLNSLFKEERLLLLETSEENLSDFLHSKVKDFSIRVPVSPAIKVGTAKRMCPHLESLGEKATFVKYVIEYLTYRHRRNSIAGGADQESGEPSSGYLTMIEENGRIRTPADTLGANTGRYRHIGVANIPRPTSLFGLEMRSMFGAGEDRIEFGLDWSAVEARVQGHYVYKYEQGPELAEMLVADKPNSIHCLSSDTEILSENGWINYKSINQDTSICQWSKDDNTLSFVKPTDIIKRQHNGYMVHILGERIDHLVSLEHRIVLFNEDTKAYVDVLAGDLPLYTYNNPNCFIPASGNNLINDTLEDVINYYLIDCKEDFEFINSKESGYFVGSYNKDLIDQVQEDLLINDCVALINIKETHKGPLYQTLIPKKSKNLKGHYLKHTTIRIVDYTLEDKTIWCVSVPTTYIVTRRNNKINISGNCVNARKMGITRDQAKTFGYSVLYGAGPPKLAKSLGVSLEEAKALFKAYWDGLPGMMQLKEKVEIYWEGTGKKHILAIDGRPLFVRSKHSLINLLFQSAGALLVKYALVEVCSRLEDLGLLGDPFVDAKDAEKVFLMITYHDEYQMSCPKSMFKIHKCASEEEAKALGKLSKSGSPSHVGEEYWVAEENILSSIFDESVSLISSMFKLNTSFGVEWQVGSNWGNCH